MEGGMYLENLEEFIFDENKIVTYKWLSQTLQVHVNQAKQMLFTFLNQQRDKDENSVNVTYLVSGLKENTHGEKVQNVSIVNAHDLEKHKTNLHKVSGVHIYSVQKTQLKDCNSLYATDYDLTLEQIKQVDCNRFSAIECAEAKPRSEREISELEEKARLADGSSHQSNGKSSISTQSAGLMNGKPAAAATTSVSSDKNNVNKTESVKPAPKPKGQQKKGQRSAMDMFASIKAKKDTVAEKDEAGKMSSSSVDKTKTENKPAKGMLAFMSKKPMEDEIEEKKVEKEERNQKKKEKEETNEEIKEKIVKNTDEKKEKKGTSNKKSTHQKAVKKQTKIQKTKRSVLPDSDEESNPKKRQRRRIMMAESSSEEDEDSDDEPIPPSPPPQQNVIPVEDEAEIECDEPSNEEGGTRVKRVRVCKTRQVLDDDGFMVTEKYYEYENMEVVDEQKPTSSEVSHHTKSDETENKKVKGKKTKGDKTSHATTQKSLMSFFKKT